MAFVYNPSDYGSLGSYERPVYSGSGRPDDIVSWARQVNKSNPYGSGNYNDSTAFYMNMMAQREQNAYETAVMNYQNEYNSPKEEFIRAQQAGINPYAAIGQTAQAASPMGRKAPTAQASKIQEQAFKLDRANSIVQNLLSISRGVFDIYKIGQLLNYNHSAFPIMLDKLGTDALFSEHRARFAPWNFGYQAINQGLSAVQSGAFLGISPKEFSALVPEQDVVTLMQPYVGVSPDSLFTQNYKTMFDLRKKEIWYKEQQKKLRAAELGQRKAEFQKKIQWRLFDEDHSRNVLAEQKRFHQAMERLGKLNAGIKAVDSLLPW